VQLTWFLVNTKLRKWWHSIATSQPRKGLKEVMVVAIVSMRHMCLERNARMFDRKSWMSNQVVVVVIAKIVVCEIVKQLERLSSGTLE
jgi:hypothetical protein